MLNSNTNLPAWNQIRAPGVDIRIPAQKLAHGESILAMGDNVPARVPIGDSIELVTCVCVSPT